MLKENATFGRRLKYAIKQAGFDRQEDFARAITKQGVSIQHSTVSRLVNGSVQPSVELLEAMADELHVSIDWLRGRSDEMQLIKLTEHERAVTQLINFLPAGLQPQAVVEIKSLCSRMEQQYRSNQELYVKFFKLIEKYGGATLREQVERDIGVNAPSATDRIAAHISNMNIQPINDLSQVAQHPLLLV